MVIKPVSRLVNLSEFTSWLLGHESTHG